MEDEEFVWGQHTGDGEEGKETLAAGVQIHLWLRPYELTYWLRLQFNKHTASNLFNLRLCCC